MSAEPASPPLAPPPGCHCAELLTLVRRMAERLEHLEAALIRRGAA